MVMWKSMSNLVIDIRTQEINQDLVETVAIIADDAQHHLVIITSEQASTLLDFNPKISTINYCSSSELETELIATLFNMYQGQKNCSLITFNNGNKILQEVSYPHIDVNSVKSIIELLGLAQLKKDKTIELITDEQIKNQFNLYSNMVLSLKSNELEFLKGNSNLNKTQLDMRVNDNTGNILELKELVALNAKYAKLNRDTDNKINSYSSHKTRVLSAFISNNFNRYGDIIEINSYPRVYKILSAFIFTCADESYYSSNYSSAYLLYFRAFETYCEGALIALNLGKVANYRSRGKTFQLLVNTNYMVPMGFGKKWGVIESTNVLDNCSSSDISNLEKHKNLRNILLYTHGEFIVNSEILNEFKNTVINVIKQMDIKLIQSSFPWGEVVEEYKSLFIYDPFKYVADLLMTEHNITIQESI
jgi:hypothetical protein